AKTRMNSLVAKTFAGKPPISLQEVAERYRKLWIDAEQQWQQAVKQAETSESPIPKALGDGDLEAIRQTLYGPEAPTTFTREQAEKERLHDRVFRDQLTALRRKVEEWKANPVAPPR